MNSKAVSTKGSKSIKVGQKDSTTGYSSRKPNIAQKVFMKKLMKDIPVKEIKKLYKDSLNNVLVEIESTIRHLTKLYANPEIAKEKKKQFEIWIKEADTRAMAVLTILRNKK